MATEFGRGVLADGPQPTVAVPVHAEAATRPARPHQVPRRTKPAQPYSSFAFSVVKGAVVVAFLCGAVLALAALNRLPAGVQDTVADSMEGFGLHLPHSDETILDRLPITTPAPGLGPAPFTTPSTMFDLDELTVDPGQFQPPAVDLPDVPYTPPPVPTVPAYAP